MGNWVTYGLAPKEFCHLSAVTQERCSDGIFGHQQGSVGNMNIEEDKKFLTCSISTSQEL